MTIESATTTTRRALLAGAAGGIGALVASAIGRPAGASANNDDPMYVGGNFAGTLHTSITNTSTGTAFIGLAMGEGDGLNGESTSGVGVHGVAGSSYGVWGHANSGYGVFGDSPTGTGVVGSSSSNVGVFGITAASGVAAIIGRSDANGTGVEGYSGPGGPAAASQPKTGVYGYAVQDSSAKGVWGRTTSGHGIHGSATSGFAGYFAGKIYTSSFLEMTEVTAPAAAAANKGRLFMRDNGSGKTQLCVRFSSGGVVVIVTQP